MWAFFVLNVVFLPLVVGGSAQQPEAIPGWIPERLLPFVLAQSLLVGFALPNSVFCLAAGALFGLGRGAFAAAAGSYGAALVSFCVGRFVARRGLPRIVRRFPSLGAFLAALGEANARIVFLTRLSPLFPFVVQNFGWSASAIRFRSYALGSLFGVPVGAVFFAHLGAAGSAGAALATGGFSWPEAVTVLGIAATFPVVRWLGRLADRALAETLPASEETGR